MNKLKIITIYALVTPALSLGANTLLAQPAAGQDSDRPQSSPVVTQGNSGAHPEGTQAATDRLDSNAQVRMPSRGFIGATPRNGIHASKLIGADVQTVADENLGSVRELIIDQDGQIIALVVGVGGFLGMGERDVAIGWDDVIRSGSGDQQELRVELTREALRRAPAFDPAE